MSDEKIRASIIRIQSEWCSPRTATHFGEECPFLLSSSFSAGASDQEISKVPTDQRNELKELWKISEKTELFKDELYHQWGIELLTPTECINETGNLQHTRSNDIRKGDLVFGRFHGDSELLIITQDGDILLCMPLDPREEWPKAANSLSDFLKLLINSQGAKYWKYPQDTEVR